MQLESGPKTVIRFKVSGLFVVDAPPTGFKTTKRIEKATKFDTCTRARAYMASRGILWEIELLAA